MFGEGPILSLDPHDAGVIEARVVRGYVLPEQQGVLLFDGGEVEKGRLGMLHQLLVLGVPEGRGGKKPLVGELGRRGGADGGSELSLGQSAAARSG